MDSQENTAIIYELSRQLPVSRCIIGESSSLLIHCQWLCSHDTLSLIPYSFSMSNTNKTFLTQIIQIAAWLASTKVTLPKFGIKSFLSVFLMSGPQKLGFFGSSPIKNHLSSHPRLAPAASSPLWASGTPGPDPSGCHRRSTGWCRCAPGW